jgi:hypothetical protein
VPYPGKFVLESGSQTSQLEASDYKIADFRQTASRHIREDPNRHQYHSRASSAARNILSFMKPEVTLVSAQWRADSV